MSALDQQCGGKHYKGMAIQPTEFAMVENYDWCCANILKYVTRAKHKNGREDIEKAVHYLALRNEIIVKHGLDRFYEVTQALFSRFGLTWVTNVELPDDKAHDSIEVYIAANGIRGTTADALRRLHWLAIGVGGAQSMLLGERLQALLDEYDEPCARGICEHDWLVHTDQDGRALGTVCGKCGTIG